MRVKGYARSYVASADGPCEGDGEARPFRMDDAGDVLPLRCQRCGVSLDRAAVLCAECRDVQAYRNVRDGASVVAVIAEGEADGAGGELGWGACVAR